METSLTRLRHIAAVARTGSFSRAAEDEGITQPALSRSIQSFERQHGVTLFERGRGGVSLTQAGALVVRYAHSLLGAASDMDRSIAAVGRGEAGRIAVGIGPLMASVLLPRIAAELLKTRPNLQIITVIRAPEQLVETLLDDSLDLVIGNTWHLGHAPWIELETLGTLPLGYAARRAHPLSGLPVRYDEVSAFPLAGTIDAQLRDLNPGSGAFVCENFHITRDVVRNSDSVWLTTPAFIETELAAGQFTMLNVTDRPLGATEICIAYRRGRPRSQATLAVEEVTRRLVDSMILREA